MVDTRCTCDPARSIQTKLSDRRHDGRAGDIARLRRRRLSVCDDLRIQQRIRPPILGYRGGRRRLSGTGPAAARNHCAA